MEAPTRTHPQRIRRQTDLYLRTVPLVDRARMDHAASTALPSMEPDEREVDERSEAVFSLSPPTTQSLSFTQSEGQNIHVRNSNHESATEMWAGDGGAWSSLFDVYTVYNFIVGSVAIVNSPFNPSSSALNESRVSELEPTLNVSHSQTAAHHGPVDEDGA